MRTIVIVKKRGDSMGFKIPESIVKKLKIKAGDECILTIEKRK